MYWTLIVLFVMLRKDKLFFIHVNIQLHALIVVNKLQPAQCVGQEFKENTLFKIISIFKRDSK